jgi:hypothetical protein
MPFHAVARRYSGIIFIAFSLIGITLAALLS